MAAAAVAVPSVAHAGDDRVVVTNFKSGLVCGWKDKAKICFETQDVQLTGQSLCVYNHENIPCTWYGFSFDYAPLRDNTDIDCTWSSSLPVVNGSPNGKDNIHRTESTYTITLKRDETHVFRPQYTGYEYGTDGSVREVHEACSYKGQALFDAVFKIQSPSE
jgi:hypothetical protein